MLNYNEKEKKWIFSERRLSGGGAAPVVASSANPDGMSVALESNISQPRTNPIKKTLQNDIFPTQKQRI